MAYTRGDIKLVRASYTALVVTLDSNYKNIHTPEALGLYKALSKLTTTAAIYPLDYTTIRGQPRKSYQIKQLDLSVISSLINAVLHVDDANTPGAFCVLELLDCKDDRLQATGEIVSAHKIYSFQETEEIPFVTLLKENILCQHWK